MDSQPDPATPGQTPTPDQTTTPNGSPAAGATRPGRWRFAEALSRDWRTHPPTDRQQEFLDEHGLWQDGMRRGQASRLIGRIKREERSASSRVPQPGTAPAQGG